MSDSGRGFELALQFDTDDPAFARGVEVGLLYAGVRSASLGGVSRYSRTVHAINAEMVLRIAEALQVPVQSEELGDEWLEVTFETDAGRGNTE